MTDRSLAVVISSTFLLSALLQPACSKSPSAPSGPIPVAGVSALTIITPSTMLQGETPVQASAFLELSDGSRVDVKTLKCETNWSSSALEVARVNQQGFIEAIGAGDATIAVVCGGLRAEAMVRVRRVFPIRGVVVEKYTSRLIPAATVTVTDGENAGMKTMTDSNGRFDLSRVVDSKVSLEISAEGFEVLMLNSTGESEARFELEPRFDERILTIGPSTQSGEWTFDFETGHTGPITVTLHADCLVHGPSWTWRLFTFVRPATNQTIVVWTGLGNGDWEAGPRRESTDATVAAPGRYVRVVRGRLNCQWTARLRYPL